MLAIRMYVVSILVVLAGCATQRPEPVKKAVEEVACCNCEASSYQAIAITQAPSHACNGACSDFPVGYRVQVPETDARIRNIDRTTVSSGEARVSRFAACNGCADGSCKSRESK